MAAAEAKRARRQEEKNRSEVEEEQRRRENLFNVRYHQDLADRVEMQGLGRELREAKDAQAKQDEARAATTGETKEVQLAAENSRNKVMADSMANAASNASMLKDNALDKYEGSLENYYRQRRDINTRMSQASQNISNQESQASVNSMGIAGAMAGVAAGAADGGMPKTRKAAAAAPSLSPGSVDVGGGTTMNADGTVTNKYNPLTNPDTYWKPSLSYQSPGWTRTYGFGAGQGIRR